MGIPYLSQYTRVGGETLEIGRTHWNDLPRKQSDLPKRRVPCYGSLVCMSYLILCASNSPSKLEKEKSYRYLASVHI